MEWVETTGKSVEEALDAALDELGVDHDDLEYETLVEPKAGLFGRFGGQEARIRARVKPLSREKPNQHRSRRRKPESARGERPPRSKGRGSGGRSREAKAEGNRQQKSDARPTKSGRGDRPRGGTQEEKPMEQVQEVPIEEQAETATVFVRGLVEAFGVDADVGSTIDDDTVLVEVDGSSLGLLVGPKGATLSAVEELVRTVLQRTTAGAGARIYVDVGGYRAQRREALAAFVEQLIEKVLDTGREQVLEPMGAGDRKVVHDTVSEVEGVSTTSEGEEPRRRVVIRRA